VRAGVVNNTCHGYGRGPLTEVVITGSCRFSDNQCAWVSEKVATVVEVTAEAVIASENRVECGREARALDLKLANPKAVTSSAISSVDRSWLTVRRSAHPGNHSTSSEPNENLNAIWRSHMNIAELKGEKTVKTLAKRLLAEPSKKQKRRPTLKWKRPCSA